MTTASSRLPREQGIALSEVPKYLPTRNGRKVHYSTIYRWATKGARGRILETQMLGGVRYTTPAALDRFLNRPPDVNPEGEDDKLLDIETALREAGI